MKYRKKPVVIEAEQWWPGVEIDGVDVIVAGSFHPFLSEGEPICGNIDTLEGMMQVNPGDYVITGVKGEKYPCKPDIFNATYEAVNQCPNCSAEFVGFPCPYGCVNGWIKT